MKPSIFPKPSTAALLAILFSFAAQDAKAAENPESVTPPAAKDKVAVTVSILPHTFLVKAVGGEHVDVNTLVSAGQDPHQFSITPAQTIALSASDVFFTSGMPFEAQFILKIRAGAPDLTIVPINKGITLLESSCTHDHSHDEEEHAHEDEEAHREEGHGEEEHEEDHHDHDHSGPDPHTWTSPALLGLQAVTVHDTLAKLAPEHAEAFADNLDDLLNDIFEADAAIAGHLKPLKGKAFFVFHPAFSYFARQYGLTEKPIEVDGKQPTPKQLLSIIKEADAADAKTIFIEPQFDTAVAGEIARQIGASLTKVDPLTEDILPSLTNFAKAIADSHTED